MSEAPKSPMHPKALPLSALPALVKGETLMLCHHDVTTFVAADAVRILGVVELLRRGELLERGRFVVIDPAPRDFKDEVMGHYCQPWYPLGRSVTWRDYPGSRAHEVPYSRPLLPHGFAVKAYTLGLMPGPNGRWSRFWLMRLNDF